MIGVIGPWNYPVLTPMGSLAYALAGERGGVQAEEFTPAVGAGWSGRSARRGAGSAKKPVLQLITGAGPTGRRSR